MEEGARNTGEGTGESSNRRVQRIKADSNGSLRLYGIWNRSNDTKRFQMDKTHQN
jgi:hypothetical protein